MVIILLLVSSTLSYAYPSYKSKPENTLIEDNKDLTNVGNEIFYDHIMVPKFNSTCNKTINYDEIMKTIQQINSLRDKSLKTLEMLENSIVEQKEAPATSTTQNLESTTYQTTPLNGLIETTTYEYLTESTTGFDLDLINSNSTPVNDELENSTTSRQIRQDVKLNVTMFEAQEDDDDGGGLLGAILSGFLGSLSKEDGSVDVDAVVRTISMLSAPQPDGTYDFTGLSDTLSAFFGGDDDDEDGGGSNVGAFAGGLTAALIKGISRPGAKGAGTLVGNLLKEVLPAISGPAEPVEENSNGKPQVDAGGFLGGLLHTLFGDNSGANKGMSAFHTVKNNLARFVFSAVSSILGTSSSGSSGGGEQKDKLILKYPK